jgi:hypothetical protein
MAGSTPINPWNPFTALSGINALNQTIPDTASKLVESGNPGRADGVSESFDLAQDKYDFDYLVFPNDIGMSDVGHYMVININVPTEGFSTDTNVRSAAGKFTNQFDVINTGNKQSKVDTLRFGGSGGVMGGDRAAFEQVPRQTRRIAQSIALFMPQGLLFFSQNEYQNISLAAAGGKLLAGAIDAVTGGIGGSVVGGILGAQSQAMGVMKMPINPAVEVIFSTTYLRSFNFTFNFAPRNEQESLALQAIIRTLRFHAAPEINTGGAGGYGIGLTWIPPAEFDITFFNKGVENFALPRINTCVLERIDVNYSPFDRYATFSNGHPVAVNMMLQFREVEVIHKARVVKGF